MRTPEFGSTGLEAHLDDPIRLATGVVFMTNEPAPRCFVVTDPYPEESFPRTFFAAEFVERVSDGEKQVAMSIPGTFDVATFGYEIGTCDLETIGAAFELFLNGPLTDEMASLMRKWAAKPERILQRHQ